ncbi:hypothetical protein A6R68_21542, partial [Neotoma lepida]
MTPPQEPVSILWTRERGALLTFGTFFQLGGMPELFQEIKPQSHYNHGYGEPLGRKTHIDDYSTWDIVKATQYGIYERCRELVEAGYDVRQPDKENVTLLHWAAINNRIDLVKYVLSVLVI